MSVVVTSAYLLANNFMKTWRSGLIVPGERFITPLWDILKGNVTREGWKGSAGWEFLIKTAFSRSAKAHYDNATIPASSAPDWELVTIPIRELIANAQLTSQAIALGRGGAQSWADIMADALNDEEADFLNLCDISAHGNGTAALAQAGPGLAAAICSITSGTQFRIYCDNNYTDSLCENVAQLKVGMKVDIYHSGSLVTGCTGLPVVLVHFEDRKNGAATYGYFDVDNGTDLDIHDGGAHAIVDGDIVYVTDSKDKLPMGVQGIYQDATHYAGVWAVDTFQSKTRSSFACLKALILQAEDFGLTTESPSNGTPTYWDLSVFGDAAADVRRGTGRQLVDFLLCHSELARAITRKGKSENSVNVVVSGGPAAENVIATTGKRAKTIDIDGRIIPIWEDDNFPKNCALLGTKDDLKMFMPPGKNFDYHRLYGDIWGPTRGESTTNMEAPYGGFCNFGAERVDGSVIIKDLRTNI